MNTDPTPFEEQLRSLQPRPLSPRATARIHRRLASPRWPWGLAAGAAVAVIALLAVWQVLRRPAAPSAELAPSPPTLLLTCQYEGVVSLDHDGPYRQSRYRISQPGGATEIIILQKASVD
ncbi:MAG: hypothetical protein N3B01_06605 [Verrucomicrobiae bacterium]|nr:hypothetical protein [Verrucomicrobiae bacterium]